MISNTLNCALNILTIIVLRLKVDIQHYTIPIPVKI